VPLGHGRGQPRGDDERPEPRHPAGETSERRLVGHVALDRLDPCSETLGGPLRRFGVLVRDDKLPVALQGGRDCRAHPRPGPHDHVNRLNALHRCLLRSPESLVTAPSGLSWRRDFAGREHRMDFELFDSDNHYYEPEDCFTRYGDETVKRYVTWVSEGKKRH